MRRSLLLTLVVLANMPMLNAGAQNADELLVCPMIVPSQAFLSFSGDLLVGFGSYEVGVEDGHLTNFIAKTDPQSCFYDHAVGMLAKACANFEEANRPARHPVPLPIALPGECKALVTQHNQETADLTKEIQKLQREQRRLKNRIRGLSAR